jgi:hypothetical protein
MDPTAQLDAAGRRRSPPRPSDGGSVEDAEPRRVRSSAASQARQCKGSTAARSLTWSTVDVRL